MSDVAGYWKRQFEKVSPRSEPLSDGQWPWVDCRPPRKVKPIKPIVPRYEGDNGILARIDARLAEQAEARFYGEQHNTRNLSELDALLERHRGRHKPDCARVMLRADIGLPPMPDAFYAMWLGKDGCL
jgi:hypothetical protein